MKPFLGVDINAEEEENGGFSGKEFLVSATSSDVLEALADAEENKAKILEKAKLPLPVRAIQWTCGFAGVLNFVVILRMLKVDGGSWGQVCHTWVPWGTGACLLICLTFSIIGHNKKSRKMKSDDSKYALTKVDAICESIYTDLKVPSDATAVDILAVEYEMEDGEPRIREKKWEDTLHINFDYKIYVEGARLFLADLEGKYAFPLLGLRTIRTVKKRIALPAWNKNIEPYKGIYKPYKIQVDKGIIRVKPYHILELEHDGEIWGIYFPCYELPVFEKLTGLKAE